MPGIRTTLKALRPKGFRGTPQTFGDHLKARRLALRLRQKDVAEQLGIDPWTLLLWEKNRTEPTAALMPAIIAFLGFDPTPEPQSLGAHIRRARRARGLTIRQAAQELNADPTALGNWENGGTILRTDHRKTIAAFIGMDEDTLDRQMRSAWNDAHEKPSE